MTTSAIIIIADALKEIRVLGENETPSSTQADDALRMLNRLLETMSINRSFSYTNDSVSYTPTGAASFTIGPTGTVVDVCPTKITSAFYTLNGISYPIRIVDVELYDSITYKNNSGAIPEMIYLDTTYPNATVYMYPLITGGTLTMRITALVKSFSSLNAQIDMPIGYEDFLMLGLAIRLSPGYGREVMADTRVAYNEAKMSVLKNNKIIPTLQLPSELSNERITIGRFIGGY